MSTHKQRRSIDGVTTAPTRRSNHVFSRLATAVLLLAVTGSITFQFLPGLFHTRSKLASVRKPKIASDPGEAWQDNIWPIRPTKPWDISTDFPHPRTLEYDVTEGTWLRLDVHPKTGDIVFDMIGDLYCLPATAYTETQLLSSPTNARPILLGVPHDSDPHFSPDGEKLVYRSDAELGVENIWITKWKGCDEMDVRPAHSTGRRELMDALEMKAVENDLLARGVEETLERKTRRLIREGRLDGEYIHILHSSYLLTDIQLNASRTKPTAGYQMPASTLPAPKSLQPNGTLPPAVLAQVKVGSTSCQTILTPRWNWEAERGLWEGHCPLDGTQNNMEISRLVLSSLFGEERTR